MSQTKQEKSNLFDSKIWSDTVMKTTQKQNNPSTNETTLWKLTSLSALLLTAPLICPAAVLANTADTFSMAAAPHEPISHTSFTANSAASAHYSHSTSIVHQLLNPTPVWTNNLSPLAQTKTVQNLFGPTVARRTEILATTVKSIPNTVNNPTTKSVALAPIDLNLGSSSDTVLASTIPNFSNVAIKVGGLFLGVTSSTNLTQAEAAAVYQVLSTGKQSLVLDAAGAASGGTLTINSTFSQALDGMHIPKGVTVIDESGKNVSINLTNGLTNYGNLYLLASTGTGNTPGVSLTAPSIENAKGAVISADLPRSINIGPGYKDALSIDLTTNTLANDGSITAGNGLITVQNANAGC